jgi:flagellar biosynthetic protein FliR
VLGQSFLIAVRVASPIFLYSVIVNFALALVNRVTPQIAIFFLAPPFILAGGIGLLYFTIRGQVAEFMAAFSSWLGTV